MPFFDDFVHLVCEWGGGSQLAERWVVGGGNGRVVFDDYECGDADDLDCGIVVCCWPSYIDLVKQLS